MMRLKLMITIFCNALLLTVAFSQDMTQTIRGNVKDIDTNQPLIGVGIWVVDFSPAIASNSDLEGNFRLENVPLGRVTIEVSYIGYENKLLSNIVVNSAKEIVLNVTLQESVVKIDEAVVSGSKSDGEALNEMAIVSARSISAEETSRYAGGFNDPSRIVSNFAGVTSTQDGSNDIIVRGNSPKYMQWRLEGVQIGNPNHFADQGGVGGSISALNNNLLATSDFYTGAFSPEYGNALSGVYDLKLRAGNNEKFESVFGFGLMGTDLTLEGPFKKGYGGSFIVNYRYSTISLLSDLGLVDITGALNFQDAAFKVVLPTKKAGIFSAFGLGGDSNFLLEDVTPAIWETPAGAILNSETKEDYDKENFLLNTGMNHSISLGAKSYLKTTVSYSAEGINDDVYRKNVIPIYDSVGEWESDSVIDRTLDYKNRLVKSTYQAGTVFHSKINARNKVQIGSQFSSFGYDNEQSRLDDNSTSNRSTLIDFEENIHTWRNYISWKHRLNENINIVAGVHHMNVQLTGENSLEPRIAANWKLGKRNSVHAGFGNHSNLEGVNHYYAQVESNGEISEPNKNLELLRANHYVAGYTRFIGKNHSAKFEVYYQDLYNLPVANDATNLFSTINDSGDTQYLELVNEGTGKNYGVEFTLEKSFTNNYYYLINGSVFESKYTALDGIERNTKFNGNYLVNIIVGKEFDGLGKEKNQSLGLNLKAFFGGARKIIPLLRDENGELSVDPENDQLWDYSKAYEKGLEDVYTVILSANYKWNKPKATHELFLSFDNLTNNKGKITEFYDESEEGNVGNLTQFGFFPNLMYRVYF